MKFAERVQVGARIQDHVQPDAILAEKTCQT